MADSFFAEFDRYCDENHIAMEETHIAFAAFLHLKSGSKWDGDYGPVSSEP